MYGTTFLNSVQTKTLIRLLLCCLPALTTLPTRAQIITTFAGTPPPPYGVSGDGGPAIGAHLGDLYHVSVTFDGAGNMYISQPESNTIRRINTAGTITTIAGIGVIGYTGDGGPALTAKLYHPGAIIVDNAGNIIFADQNGAILRQIDPTGHITTISGPYTGGLCSGEGVPLSQAVFVAINGLAKDNAGNIYATDQACNVVRKISTGRIVTTVAGNGTPGFSGDGGPATSAQLWYPCQVGVDLAGNIYIPDADNNRIRKVSTSGIITTTAGNGGQNSTGDGGPAALAEFALPCSIVVDNAGNIFVGENSSYVVRKIDPSGIVTDFAGNGTYGYSGDGGPANLAQVTQIENIDMDAAGNIYIVDAYNQVIRKVTNCPTTSSTTPPSLRIAPSATTICSGTQVIFKATPVNGGAIPSYQWQVNATNVGSDNAVFTTTDLADGDIVSCILTSSVGCGTPAQDQVTMTVNTSPTLILMPDTIVGPGHRVALRADVTGPVTSYQWTPAIGLDDPYKAAPVAAPPITTTYQVVVATDDHCTATGKVTVGIFRGVAMPGAFTPNGDGRNDLFRIPSSLTVKIRAFVVYDRLGSKVFYSSNSAVGWDGTTGGRPQPAGTYVWIMEYEDALTGKVTQARGTVILVR